MNSISRVVSFLSILIALLIATLGIGAPIKQRPSSVTEDPQAVALDEEAAKWGTLAGRFIYDGEPPEPETLDLRKAKDAPYLPEFVELESLVVNKVNRGIANVILYLIPPKGTTVEVHPNYEKTAEDDVHLLIKDSRFEPHVVLLRTSQTLVQENKDGCAHHFHATPFRNTASSAILSPQPYRFRYPQEESIPMHCVCDIHNWEQCWVVVQDNPYMATTDRDGKFTIKNLPVGTHTFRVWHEQAGFVGEINQPGFVATKSGKLTVTIKPGDNQLPTVKITPEKFW